METVIRKYFEALHSAPDDRYKAYQQLMALSNERVDWAYAVWNDLVVMLENNDNHLRSIAAQLLSQLAISDPEGRMLQTLSAITDVTYDERFVTARHSLQSIWKIALANDALRQKVLDFFDKRFSDAEAHKNGTLVRFDIIESLRKIYDHKNDDQVKAFALGLIDLEKDNKYRAKYAKVWKDLTR